MTKTSDCYIKEALELARQLTLLSDYGEAVSKDDGCAVLYGIIRDSAYKIRNKAEEEQKVHKGREMAKGREEEQ